MLEPLLFGIVTAAMIYAAYLMREIGIKLRCGGDIFKIRRLKAKTRILRAGVCRRLVDVVVCCFVNGRCHPQQSRNSNLKLSETQNTSSAVMFIYNFQLREFRFFLYR